MKIIPESLIAGNKNITRRQSADDCKTPSESVGKSLGRDKITIAASQGEVSDAQLIAQLKKSLSAEIQAGASERKLDDLRQEIALGEYDVNIPDIIRKMLLDEAPYE